MEHVPIESIYLFWRKYTHYLFGRNKTITTAKKLFSRCIIAGNLLGFGQPLLVGSFNKIVKPTLKKTIG